MQLTSNILNLVCQKSLKLGGCFSYVKIAPKPQGFPQCKSESPAIRRCTCNSRAVWASNFAKFPVTFCPLVAVQISAYHENRRDAAVLQVLVRFCSLPIFKDPTFGVFAQSASFCSCATNGYVHVAVSCRGLRCALGETLRFGGYLYIRKAPTKFQGGLPPRGQNI